MAEYKGGILKRLGLGTMHVTFDSSEGTWLKKTVRTLLRYYYMDSGILLHVICQQHPQTLLTGPELIWHETFKAWKKKPYWAMFKDKVMESYGKHAPVLQLSKSEWGCTQITRKREISASWTCHCHCIYLYRLSTCFITLYTTHSRRNTMQAHWCVGSLSLGDLIFSVAQCSPAPSRQNP